MHLIQIVLPLTDNRGTRFAPSAFDKLQKELAGTFGGVAAYVRAPAIGIWKEGAKGFDKEEVVVFEVLAEHLDKQWWSEYRQALEARFDQKEIFVCAIPAERL